MKAPTSAPAYAAMYHEIAEVARKHGYALAIHGSLQRDFDLIAIPWTDNPSDPQSVFDELTGEFGLKHVGKIGIKPHGRSVYTLTCGWGECFLDLGFMPRLSSFPVDAEDGEATILHNCECGGTESTVTGWEEGIPIEGNCRKCGSNVNLTDE